MLDWIKAGRSEHPLADEKSARAAIADLPADAFKALEEMGRWLDELHGEEALKLARLIDIVDRVDHAARAHLRKLQLDYIAGGGRLKRFQENRIRSTASGFWKRLADAHTLILRRFQSGASGWGATRGTMPLVIARGMRALTMRLKWQLLAYGPVAPDVWSGLGRFQAYAEEKDIAGLPVTVYPGSESTIQREYLKAVMLAVSSTDSLLPLKLDIAERLIAHFADRFVMRRQPAIGCHFHADLAGGAMPARFVERVGGDAIRFFGPGDAAKGLAELTASIRASGALPAEVALGATPDAASVSDVAQHLAHYWGEKPPARSGERRRSLEKIDVVHGYDEILARLRDDDSQDLDFNDGAETWSVENESEGGYGALMPASRGDWVRVGTLLGVRLSDGAAWGVGVVRRMTTRDRGERHVGIQLFSRGASIVTLRSGAAASASQQALLLLSDTTDSLGQGELSLLLREGTFSKDTSLEMDAYARRYLLVPRALLEGGHDFDIARYRVLQRAAS